MTTDTNQAPETQAKPKPAPVLRPSLKPAPSFRTSAKPLPARRLEVGSDLGKVCAETAKEAASGCMVQYFPMFGTVWFSYGKKQMGLIHILICCVAIPVGVYLSGLGGNAPFANILKFVAMVVGAWVVGFVLTAIGCIVGEAKNAKEVLRNIIVTVLIVCAFLVYYAFFD